MLAQLFIGDSAAHWPGITPHPLFTAAILFNNPLLPNPKDAFLSLHSLGPMAADYSPLKASLLGLHATKIFQLTSTLTGHSSTHHVGVGFPQDKIPAEPFPSSSVFSPWVVTND